MAGRFPGRVLVHLLAAVPLVFWAWQVVRTLQGELTLVSTDPGATLANQTGFWAINFLLLTLAMTPLQRRTRRPFVRYRRALGLWCFTYALFHLMVFYFLILNADAGNFLHELTRRPYIVLGASAFLILTALAVTSNQASMRRLRKKWKKLHRLVYPASLLILVHELWQVKSFEMVALWHTLLLLALLIMRVPFKRIRKNIRWPGLPG